MRKVIDFAPKNKNIPFSNSTIDSAAFRISKGQTASDVRDYLLNLGLSPYNAYLCYKAAVLLINSEFYG